MWTLFLAITAAANFALGTSFYERPFPEAIKNAPIMARGKIGASTVDMATISDGSQLMFTFYDFKVTEVLKGDLKLGQVKIREIGGEKNGVGMTVSGAAAFSSGEDVVVVLDQPVNEVYPLRGMMMGRFALEKGSDGKEYLKGAGVGTAHPQTQWSLDAVRDLIQKQKEEADTAPVVDATKSSESEKKSTDGKKSVSQETPMPKTSEEANAQPHSEASTPEASGKPFLRERRVPSIWVVLAGIGTGVYFYLRTKRRK